MKNLAKRLEANTKDVTHAARVCALACVYFAAAVVALSLNFAGGKVTPVWPPAGIAVAALLVVGDRYWPVSL
jgi:integral membrane sensor domain MASE1